MATPKKTPVSAAKLPPETPSELISLKAVEPIRIDGVDVAPGKPFLATPNQAEELIFAGVAQESAE